MIFITFLLVFHLIGFFVVYNVNVFGKTVKEKEKVFVIMSFITLFAFSAFRSIEIGNDTYNYYKFYENLTPFKFNETRFEFGYVMLNSLIKTFFINPQFLFIISSFIILISIYRFFIDKSNLLWLALLIFLLSHTYFGTFNTIRQYLAFAFLVFAYNGYRDKKYFIFVLMTFLAFLFHKSAIVFLGLIFTPLLKTRNKSIILILITSFIIIIVPISVYQKIPYFDVYLSGVFDNANRPAAILNSLIVLIVLSIGFIYRGNRQEISLLEKMTMISFFISILGIKTSVATRLNIYFFPFVIVYLTNTIYIISNKKEQMFFISIVIIMFTLNYYVIAIYRPEWNYIYPYRFFFQNNEKARYSIMLKLNKL